MCLLAPRTRRVVDHLPVDSGPGEDLFLIVLFVVLLILVLLIIVLFVILLVLFTVVGDFAELVGFGDLL